MRICICDDHPIVVLSMVALFEAHGHEVVGTVGHPALVPGLVAEQRPDVCVLDLLYDDVPDALAALAAIGAVAPQTDVIVVSGAADPMQRQASLSAGAVAVASKACPPDELMALVEGRTEVVAESPRSNRNPYFLTQREFQVLQSLIEGDSTERMAGRLGMRHATARSHVQSLLLKLGVHSRTAAVSIGVKQNLLALAS